MQSDCSSKLSLQYMPLNFHQQKESLHFKKLTNRLSLAALASVEYGCSDLRWCYLQQTFLFFQSDPHAVIPNKLAMLIVRGEPASTRREAPREKNSLWSQGLRVSFPCNSRIIYLIKPVWSCWDLIVKEHEKGIERKLT